MEGIPSNREQLELVKAQAIDMCDFLGADSYQAQINALQSPLESLVQKPANERTFEDVQHVINWLDPRSPAAVSEAEEVLGLADVGWRQHPDDDGWAEVTARAYKIFQHRIGGELDTRQQG
jgi:hypothetical protein